MVEITAVHMSSPFSNSHEHIVSVRWVNPETGERGESPKQAMVDWLEKPGTRAYVRTRWGVVEVGIVRGFPPHIRTYADGIWADNLLALPRY